MRVRVRVRVKAGVVPIHYMYIQENGKLHMTREEE